MAAAKKSSRLVWSTGEPYSQSSRYIYESNDAHIDESREINEENHKQQTKQIQSDQINQSDANNYQQTEMERVNDFLHPTTDLMRNKQREKFDFQIADREMFPQCGTNPFFTDSSYIDQISTQINMRQKN